MTATMPVYQSPTGARFTVAEYQGGPKWCVCRLIDGAPLPIRDTPLFDSQADAESELIDRAESTGMRRVYE